MAGIAAAHTEINFRRLDSCYLFRFCFINDGLNAGRKPMIRAGGFVCDAPLAGGRVLSRCILHDDLRAGHDDDAVHAWSRISPGDVGQPPQVSALRVAGRRSVFYSAADSRAFRIGEVSLQ